MPLTLCRWPLCACTDTGLGGLGHRMVVFSTLVHTVDSPTAEWSALLRYHTKRNSSEYAGLSNVSAADARDLIELTSSLYDRVRALTMQRPQP